MVSLVVVVVVVVVGGVDGGRNVVLLRRAALSQCNTAVGAAHRSERRVVVREVVQGG
jgi:hypothetical protein